MTKLPKITRAIRIKKNLILQNAKANIQTLNQQIDHQNVTNQDLKIKKKITEYK